MNKCIFVGRTTRDFELRYSQGEKPIAVASSSIAVDTGYGERKKTSFFNITSFGRTAEVMEQYVKKGTKIILECEAVQNEYKNKEGKRVSSISFDVKSFEFAESKGSTISSKKDEVPRMDAPTAQSVSGFYPTSDIEDDDVPF